MQNRMLQNKSLNALLSRQSLFTASLGSSSAVFCSEAFQTFRSHTRVRYQSMNGGSSTNVRPYSSLTPIRRAFHKTSGNSTGQYLMRMLYAYFPDSCGRESHLFCDHCSSRHESERFIEICEAKALADGVPPSRRLLCWSTPAAVTHTKNATSISICGLQQRMYLGQGLLYCRNGNAKRGSSRVAMCCIFEWSGAA